MILEQFPQFERLNPQDQLILAGELWQRATSASEKTPDLSEEAIQLIEQRLDDYLENPSTGISWSSVRQVLQFGI